jgi:putative zinc finger protein
VVSERCERFRESFSLQLDGMLSRFESVLLDRHLRRCAGCRAFADAADEQTKLLRAAPLAPLERSLADSFAQPKQPARRRRIGAFAGALAVAAAAALVALTPNPGRRSEQPAAATQGRPLLAVFPMAPKANATFEVPRLRVVSPASADGAVRGYYGRSASI